MNDIAADAPLDILATKAAPIMCVPAIMDLELLPDMGRMTGRLPLPEVTACSLRCRPWRPLTRCTPDLRRLIGACLRPAPARLWCLPMATVRSTRALLRAFL